MSPLPCLRNCIFALLLAGLAGCVSVPDASGPVNVYVSSGGSVTYDGTRLSLDQLADRLNRADIDKKREIRIHMEDIGNKQIMAKITGDLHKKGFSRVLFRDEPQGSAEVIGEPESHVEAPALTRPPPRH